MSDPILLTDSRENIDTRWGTLKQEANEIKALRAVQYLRSHGIEPILIKGVACAHYYPKDMLRDSMDTDLAVSIDNFEAANELVRLDRGSLGIDLHCELRQLDTVPWSELVANSRSLEVAGVPVTVLAAEDHLRVLSTHWLMDGGRYRHRLWDLYYIFNRERQNIDWSRLLDIVDERRRRWIVCALGSASLFLGLNLSGTPIENAVDALPSWFTSTIESEWQLPAMHALFHSTNDPKLFWQQLRRRLPPNPITATIMANGSLDARTRFFYYAGNILRRTGPSILNTIRSVNETRRG